MHHDAPRCIDSDVSFCPEGEGKNGGWKVEKRNGEEGKVAEAEHSRQEPWSRRDESQ